MFPLDSRILVVNGVKTLREMIINTCKDLGYSNFLESDTAEHALRFFELEPYPDLVISDYELSGMDGVQFFKNATNLLDADSQVPFILVTAEAKKDIVLKAIEAGVSDYLLKPFSPAVLREKLSVTYEKTIKNQ